MLILPSDDDEPRKIQVKIKPKEQTASPALSVDELRAVGAQLTLNSPSTVVSFQCFVSSY